MIGVVMCASCESCESERDEVDEVEQEDESKVMFADALPQLLHRRNWLTQFRKSCLRRMEVRRRCCKNAGVVVYRQQLRVNLADKLLVVQATAI